MRAQSMRMAGALLAAGWLAAGLALAEEAKPAPVKTPLEVTYYYLPG
jgi:hypothetical protein